MSESLRKTITLTFVFAVILLLLQFLLVHTNLLSGNISRKHQQVGKLYLGVVGVAISNNIGNFQSEINKIPVTLVPENIATSAQIGDTATIRKTYIHEHMNNISSHADVLSIDIRQLLSAQSDPSFVFDAYVDQLQFWHEKSVENIIRLQEDVAILDASLTGVQTRISQAQASLSTAFGDQRADDVIIYNDVISGLRAQEQEIVAQRVFTQKFGTQYQWLDRANRLRYETLIVNKRAIIDGNIVTIPEVGTAYLNDLGLIKNQTSQ